MNIERARDIARGLRECHRYDLGEVHDAYVCLNKAKGIPDRNLAASFGGYFTRAEKHWMEMDLVDLQGTYNG